MGGNLDSVCDVVSLTSHQILRTQPLPHGFHSFMSLPQIHRVLRSFSGVIAGVLVACQSVMAQAPAPPPTAAPIVVAGRGLGLEWGITILMIGLAIYVVCRSSHRN